MKTFTFDVEGRELTGTAVFKDGVLWAHIGGQTFVHESASKRGARRGAKAAGSLNPGEVTAPMPGKIIKVMTSNGSAVQAQDVLVVMEAMKMEYTLKAQAAGRVGQIACAAGDQVALGQLLVKLDLV